MVAVQFYPWFNFFCSILTVIQCHIQKQTKIKTEPQHMQHQTQSLTPHVRPSINTNSLVAFQRVRSYFPVSGRARKWLYARWKRFLRRLAERWRVAFLSNRCFLHLACPNHMYFTIIRSPPHPLPQSTKHRTSYHASGRKVSLERTRNC